MFIFLFRYIGVCLMYFVFIDKGVLWFGDLISIFNILESKEINIVIVEMDSFLLWIMGIFI